MKNVLRKAIFAFSTCLTLIFFTLAAGNYAMAQSSSDLFFSEYLEGTSFNKAVEIYNPTGATIDFTGYAVAVYTNGSVTASITFNLNGSLASGAVYVIANSQSDPLVLAVADTVSGVCNFNGDDAVVLLKNGTPIDIIGQIGFDPGTSWAITGGAATVDFTLIRKSSVSGPETDWNVCQNQWDFQPQNTFSFLGSHIGPVGILEVKNNNSFDIVPNPATASFSIRLNAKSKPVVVEIFDMIGNKVMSASAIGRNQVDISHSLKPGVYMVKVETEGARAQTRRLVIQAN